MKFKSMKDLYNFLDEETFHMNVIMWPAEGTPWNAYMSISFLDVDLKDDALIFSNERFTDESRLIFHGEFESAEVEREDDGYSRVYLKFKNALPVEILVTTNEFEDMDF